MTVTADRRRTNRSPYLLLVPAVGILIIGMGYPLIWQVVTSMQEYGLQQVDRKSVV